MASWQPSRMSGHSRSGVLSFTACTHAICFVSCRLRSTVRLRRHFAEPSVGIRFQLLKYLRCVTSLACRCPLVRSSETRGPLPEGPALLELLRARRLSSTCHQYCMAAKPHTSTWVHNVHNTYGSSYCICACRCPLLLSSEIGMSIPVSLLRQSCMMARRPLSTSYYVD